MICQRAIPDYAEHLACAGVTNLLLFGFCLVKIVLAAVLREGCVSKRRVLFGLLHVVPSVSRVPHSCALL